MITDDQAGQIYVGGGRGLDRLDPASDRVKHFTTSDGLPRGLFRAAFRDSCGLFWFGMLDRLARLTSSELFCAPSPVVLISAVRVRRRRRNACRRWVNDELSLPDLGRQQDQLQIDFIGARFRFRRCAALPVPVRVCRIRRGARRPSSEASPTRACRPGGTVSSSAR